MWAASAATDMSRLKTVSAHLVCCQLYHPGFCLSVPIWNRGNFELSPVPVGRRRLQALQLVRQFMAM
jgi:hypothetical protein